ncbi:MAG TPA: 16S rRNA (cytosine(1402)-N(4))-methyltransferase RsmH [Syntrophobacteraceae bacterium]|nr:16S rRNA (cytosine(1402)-N(4))-methyltransferase RsmH [Syntrophobacteraceae bacterium]
METKSPVGHVPVLGKAAVDLLGCSPGKLYVDGTVGGGGYTEAILQRSAPDGRVLGLDWDEEAVERVRERFSHEPRLVLRKAGFSDLHAILEEMHWGPVHGIVIDLGVSTFQLDDPRRGFSFLRQGPLDMRMDLGISETAADLVNSLSQEDLANLIFRLGEERYARPIARAIVTRRRRRPFTGTLDLAAVIETVVPRTRDTLRIHPATRTFQALRMAVNQELESLEAFLSRVLGDLRSGGRLCVVSFHSLEDRMVKDRFRSWARSCRCPEDLPVCRCEGRPLGKLLTRKAVRPDPEEVKRNPRARSARLRAVEKI